MVTISSMNPLSKRLAAMATALVIVGGCTLTSSVHAQTKLYWNGAPSATWNNAANWVYYNLETEESSPGVIPTASLMTYFDSAGPGTSIGSLGANQSVLGLFFETLNSPFTLGDLSEGFTLSIGGAGIVIDDPNFGAGPAMAPVTINSAIVVAATQSWNNRTNQIFTAAGNLTLAASLTLTDDPSGSGNSTGSFVLGSAGKELVNSGGNRTIFVQDTGANTELTINSNIILSDHTTNGRTLTLNLGDATKTVINGDILNGSSGASNFTQSGNGDLTINGTTNISGAFTLNGTGDVAIKAASFKSGSFNLNDGSVSFSGSQATLGGLVIASSTPNALSFAPGLTLNLTGDVTVRQTTPSLTINPATIGLGGQRTFFIAKDSTLTIDANTTISGTAARLHKADEGTLILKGTSTYDGQNNALTAGTLILDFSANTAAKLSSQDLTIYNSTLILRGNASSAVTQSMKNLRIAAGANYNTASSKVILEPTGGQALVLALGQIVRDNSSAMGTLHFVIPANAQVTTAMADTPILSGWATMNDGNSDSFVAIKNGQLVAATSAVPNNDLTRQWAPTLVNSNVTDLAAYSGTTDYMNVSSLRFTSSAPVNVIESLHIESGGILVASTSTANGIHDGTLTVGESNDELIVHHHGNSSFEISANLRNYHDQTTEGVHVTKTGTGELILSGQNRTAAQTAVVATNGVINILEGTLTLAGGRAVSDHTAINLSSSENSTLKLLSSETVSTITSLTRSSKIDVGSHTLTTKQGASTQFQGELVGSGTIVKDELNPLTSTNWTLSGSSSPNFTGHLVVNRGLVILSGSNVLNLNAINSITLNHSGGLLLDNHGAAGGSGPLYTEVSRINDNASVTLNGANARISNDSNAAITGFAIRNNNNTVHAELIRDLNVNSGASYIVMESTATATVGTSNNATIIRATNAINRNQNATLSVIGTNLAAASNARTRLQMTDGNATTLTAAFANQFRTGAYANGATPAAANGASETPSGTNMSIVPWAIGQNIAGAATATTLGNTFVIVEADFHGFRALRLDNEYAQYATASTGNGHNIRESSMGNIDLTATGGKTVNSLLINNQNNSADGITVTGSGTLSNTSGAFLFTGVGDVDGEGRANANAVQGGITLNGFSNIEVTGPNKEYIVFVTNTSAAGATITSNLTTADSTLTKSGVGLLKLTGDNQALTAVTLNEGTLEISNRNNIGGTTGILNLAGGTLKLADQWLADEQDLTGFTIKALDGTTSRINTNGSTGAAGADDTRARLTLGPLAAGSGTLIKEGNGRLTLTGTTGTLHTGDFYLYHTGNADGAPNGNIPQLLLQNTGGNSIGGDLYIGSPDHANAVGGATVFLGASNQIADTAVVTLYGNGSGGGNRAYFHLRGFSETIAGLQDATGNGVVQNGASSTSTLTVSGDGDYLYAGYLRDQSGALAFTKAGTGTQTLKGLQITYTGTTKIDGGLLILSNTTGFNSNITNNANLELERTSSTWAFGKIISGSGNLIKSGNGSTTLGAANTYTGTTDINAGTLALGDAGSINGSRAINIKHGAIFDVSAKGISGYSYGHILSGGGTISGSINLTTGGSLRPGASSGPSFDATTGDQFGALTINGNLRLLGGATILQMSMATLNDSGVGAAFTAGSIILNNYLTENATSWDNSSYIDANGIPKHDYIDVNGDLVWDSGSIIRFVAEDTYTPTVGDIFNFWDWNSLDGSFNLGVDDNMQRGGGLLGDLELPSFAGILYDLTLFESHGIAVVVMIPEPSKGILLLLGLSTLFLRRRR
jgi:fibronectin-binding autotransporter adhesin